MDLPPPAPRIVPELLTEPSLGQIPVLHKAWQRPLAVLFLDLAAKPPQGVGAFRRFSALSDRHRHRWREIRDGSKWNEIETSGLAHQFQVATALLSLPAANASDIQRTLAWLTLELHLMGLSAADLAPLCSCIRGIREGQSNKLRDGLGDCDGLEALLDRLRFFEDQAGSAANPLDHGTFGPLWKRWLKKAVCRLLEPPVSDDEKDEIAPTPLDAIEVPPAVVLGTDTYDSSEPDDIPSVALSAVERAENRHGLKNRLAEAIGGEIYRRTCPDLLRDPDNILPRWIARQSWQKTFHLVCGALDDQKLALAEAGIAHLICIEAGLTPSEAHKTVFGLGEAESGPVIDLDVGALRRPELRPKGAYAPKDSSTTLWEPSGGNVLFPLSPRAIELCVALLRLRSSAVRRIDTPLLLSDEVDPGDLQAWLTQKRPRFTTSYFETTRSATTTAFRMRIAACVAEKLGPDAAQIAFGDSFGASAAPTYYSAFSATTLAEVIASANVGLDNVDATQSGSAGFDLAPRQPAELSPALQAACTHFVGSRVRAPKGLFEDLWISAGIASRASRGRPRVFRKTEEWRRKRDCLALHLMFATAHRPGEALGAIRLTDFVPSHALVVIRDKRSDPSRLTRLTCTGWSFIGALESYVADLRRLLADTGTNEQVRSVTHQILCGEVPLLTLPTCNSSGREFRFSDLFRQLPKAWQERSNVHRHALDQALISASVRPEIRFFQMGWLEGEAHAVSDLSPYPPAALGPILAKPIDDWLRSEGWHGGSAPRDPQGIFANLPLVDFDAAVRAHRSETEWKVHELKQALAERRQEVTPDVIRELVIGVNALPEHLNVVATAMKDGSGKLRIDKKRVDSNGGELTRHHVEAILGKLRSASYQPIHAYVGSRVLSSALMDAYRRKQCAGYLPPIHHPTFRSIPSPFAQGLGLAVAAAGQVRDAVFQAASEPSGWMNWRAHICLLSILACTPHRSLADARQILLACGKAEHSEAKPWLLRIPLGNGHIGIIGEAAILLNRLRKTDGWQASVVALGEDPTKQIGRFAKVALKSRVPAKASDSDAGTLVVQALVMAGVIELTGPQRIILNGTVNPSFVRANRIAALEDGESLLGDGAPNEEEAQERTVTRRDTEKLSRRTNEDDRLVRDLMKLFQPEYQGVIDGRAALPGDHRIAQLRPYVDGLLERLGSRPTVPRMMLRYVQHLMVEGGPRSSGGSALGTIYKDFHYVRLLLAAIPPEQDLSESSEEQVTGAVLASLAFSRNKNKPVVLGELRRFFSFARRDHDIPEPNWDLAYKEAGLGIKGSDPAVFSDDEAAAIIRELRENLSPEKLAGVDAIEHRFRELQLASSLLLEASSARPQSVYGLTLADFHLSNEGDFVHLRGSGKFAAIKTSTSAGFIPLDSEIWPSYRDWFKSLLERLRRGIPEDAWIKTPLFRKPQGAVDERFARRPIMERIGQLVRWRTRQPRGRTYWFRKRGVGRRHASIRKREAASAWSVYRVMRTCGHATIATPIASYIGDPMVWCDLSDAVSLGSDRRKLSSLSGTSLGTLDQRWHRRRISSKANASTEPMDRLELALHLSPPDWPETELPSPPPHKPFIARLTLESVASVMGAIADGHPKETISELTGVDLVDIPQIIQRCVEIARRTGFQVSKGELCTPRRTAYCETFLKQAFKGAFDLRALADDWVHCARIRTQPGTIALIGSEAIEQLKSLAKASGLEVRFENPDRPESGVYLANHRRRLYGGEMLLRWALAVVWVASGLKACEPLGPAP